LQFLRKSSILYPHLTLGDDSAAISTVKKGLKTLTLSSGMKRAW